MFELLLKPEAEKDLIKIFEYTFYNWGIQQAEKYQDELYSGMEQILSQENIGKVYPFSTKKYRKIHINRHLIFYRVESNKCIIVRILHDKMEIKNHLK